MDRDSRSIEVEELFAIERNEETRRPRLSSVIHVRALTTVIFKLAHPPSFLIVYCREYLLPARTNKRFNDTRAPRNLLKLFVRRLWLNPDFLPRNCRATRSASRLAASPKKKKKDGSSCRLAANITKIIMRRASSNYNIRYPFSQNCFVTKRI